ncbi:hypothetical protein L1N85_11450 [Paenibacillus alkaliterrae]|uniref:hypothetical protein n=1 Tax=Paenibacillus alkaliterrae TaxID=320909 RepID=UPI001F4929A2|nr:hypothetical protein [Paenibacillus alkaliterrae]MCF2939052.1 hypothetical protein [Paenibacillus alkaliterrae]
MQSLARNGFSHEQVKAALHAPNRSIAFRYDLLDSQSKFKSGLTNVLSGTVSNNALADIKRTARFSLRDDGAINFLSDRIKPYVRLWIPPGRILARHYAFLQASQPFLYQTIQESPEAGGWIEWPLGVFMLSTPVRRSQDSGAVIRDIEAYDQAQILREDKVTSQYFVAAGINYVTAVKTLLDGASIAAQNLTPSSRTLPVDREWPGGTPKLEIINELLAALNYDALYFDEDGVAVARPYVTPDQRASEYVYADDAESVIFPEVEETLDLFNVPNKFVLVVSQPDRPVLKSVYTNSNPSSMTSSISRGRTIVDYLQVDAADQATLDSLAQTAAIKASQVYQTVTLQTAIMPQHSYNDVFSLRFSALGIDAKYEEIGWSMALKAGGQMRHTIRRIVTV